MPECLPGQEPPPGPPRPGSCAPAASAAGTRLVVAAAVVDSLRSPARLLCAARSYPPELVGRFELPGGKVEPGEAPTAALARELAEEVSLTVRLGPELVPPPVLAAAWQAPAGSCPSPGAGGTAPAPAPPAAAAGRGLAGTGALTWPVSYGMRMRVWLAEPADPGECGRLGADHLALEWVGLEALTALPWLRADVPIVHELLARVGQPGSGTAA